MGVEPIFYIIRLMSKPIKLLALGADKTLYYIVKKLLKIV